MAKLTKQSIKARNIIAEHIEKENNIKHQKQLVTNQLIIN